MGKRARRTVTITTPLHDPLGNVVSTTEPEGNETTYLRDAWGAGRKGKPSWT